MIPNKLIRYSIPFFAFAIISRAIEEISFIYYAVPVMCVVFIIYNLVVVKSYKSNVKRQKQNDKLNQTEKDTSTTLSVTENKEVDDQHTNSKISHPSPLFSAQGGFRFAQHHLRQRRISLRSTSTLFLIPGLWFLLTSLWSSYPTISATRALYFILLSTGCISAGILWIRYSGKGVLDLLLPANIFIVLLCLLSLVTNIPSDSWTGGHGKGFMGFFGHQNLLASVILFTVPAVFSKLLRVVKNDQSTVNRTRKTSTHYLLLTTYYLLLTANLVVLTLTYSRASILSLIFGAIVFLLLNRNWKVLAYSFGVCMILTLLFFLTPSLNQFTDKIIKKDFPEFYSSRMWMWEPSYRAAIDGGLIGLGYGISDPNEKVGGIGDHYEGERFVREKGNSTLALVEETGVIGLILFLLPLVYLAKKLKIKNEQLKIDYNYSSLLILSSSLAAMLLHSQFEAWWVGVGSVQLPLFFAYLGLIVQDSKFGVTV